MKIVKQNQLKIVIYRAVKNRCMLHGRVFVMRRRFSQLSNTSFLVATLISFLDLNYKCIMEAIL